MWGLGEDVKHHLDCPGRRNVEIRDTGFFIENVFGSPIDDPWRYVKISSHKFTIHVTEPPEPRPSGNRNLLYH